MQSLCAQIRPFAADPASPTMIKGIDGTTYTYADITFNSANYTFTYDDGSGAIDITGNMYRADMLTFPGFDPTVANNLLSYNAGRTQVVDAAGIAPGAELNTNTASIFAQDVGQTLSSAVNTGATVGKYVVIGAVAIALIMILKNNK